MKARNRTPNQHGTNSHLAKLSAEDVRYIRESGKTLKHFCEKFGIAKSTASMIRSGATYKNLPMGSTVTREAVL